MDKGDPPCKVHILLSLLPISRNTRGTDGRSCHQRDDEQKLKHRETRRERLATPPIVSRHEHPGGAGIGRGFGQPIVTVKSGPFAKRVVLPSDKAPVVNI